MKRRYIMSGGLAFSEEKDMMKLSRLSKKGWVFDRFTFMGYILKKGEPQELQFAIDYRSNPDEEYFELFREAGWTHVGSQANYIHLFTAQPGVTPIYTDRPSTLEKYSNEKNFVKKGAIWSLAVTLCIALLLYLVYTLTFPDAVEAVLSVSLSVLLGLSLISLIFTGLPYLGYVYKIYKLR
ncbi:DUF2812 domain-containing protein [Jeotgalibacillus aurantiacus]|uniref:DUF2812 domain-containing protein n=1 Tax=Jeotgalibacillus aurantiacus TaxID=2763266 RepID=UPI001D09A00A|nr:DUF2812 domain-containing protein [Jeotgalibacillus aurantiacus]